MRKGGGAKPNHHRSSTDNLAAAELSQPSRSKAARPSAPRKRESTSGSAFGRAAPNPGTNSSLTRKRTGSRGRKGSKERATSAASLEEAERLLAEVRWTKRWGGGEGGGDMAHPDADADDADGRHRALTPTPDPGGRRAPRNPRDAAADPHGEPEPSALSLPIGP